MKKIVDFAIEKLIFIAGLVAIIFVALIFFFLLKGSLTFFKEYNFFDFIAPKYGMKSKTIFTFCKTNPVPNIHKTNFLSATEYIWVGVKKKGRIANFLGQNKMLNYWIGGNAATYKATDHPTEKPLDLYEYFVTICSNPEEIILDPFAGSGTSLVAAKKLNRFWIGIEKDPHWAKVAEERIKQTTIQAGLF